MSGLYQLKPAFQEQLRPLVAQLATWGVTANQVTIAAVLLSGLAGIAIAAGHPWRGMLLLIPLVSFVRMALNAIDGMLAREYGMKSALGAILNELGDVVSDAALYLPFSLIAGVKGYLLVLIVILSIISEMAGVLGAVVGGQRRYDGYMGKSDRAFVFSVIALLLASGVTPGAWLDWVWIGVTGLLVWTIRDRVRNALLEVENHDQDGAAH